MEYFAGLDIGTTHTKLLVCNRELEIIFQSKSVYTKGFGATLDANEILHLAAGLIQEADQKLSFSVHNVTLSFSAAMHSLLFINQSAEPLTQVFTWADITSQPVIATLNQDPVAQQLFFETGTPLHPMSPFTKLAWFSQADPVLLMSAFKCIGIKEFLWFHFTGSWEIDHSLASATGLFSFKLMNWLPEAIRIAGVKSEQLSTPVLVTKQRNSKYSPAVLSYNLSENISWIIGGSDGCLAQIGSGAIYKGTAALTIGTSGAIRILLSKPWTDPHKELFTYILDEGEYVCGGATNNGGIVLQWWEKEVMSADGNAHSALDSFTSLAATVNPGADGLVCLPYFGGERSPIWNAEATGVFAGIKISHGQAHFKRAMLEGIGFSFRQLLEKLEAAGGPVHTIFGSGGFTNNSWWVQLMSDILQRPVMVTKAEADASALGAIAIGMKATGRISNWEDFKSLLKLPQIQYNPDPQTKPLYENNYKYFLRLCHC
jgi:gluconokinase